MEMIEFHVPAIPISQPRPRHFKGITVSAPQKHPVNAFKASVALALREKYDGAPLGGPISLAVLFVMPRPQNMMWKTKPMRREPHTKKPDVDNLLKSVVDAMNKLAWRDDSQISFCFASKMIADGNEQPHVEITISSPIETEL